MKNMDNDPDLQDEYDFSKGVRGKYAARYAEGTNIVAIDPDLVEHFPTQEAVNSALRHLAEIIRASRTPS